MDDDRHHQRQLNQKKPKGKSMSVVYETKHPGTGVLITKKRQDGTSKTILIPFNKTSKFVPGTLTVDEALAKHYGVTVDEITIALEQTEMYTTAIPGVKGIYRRSERGLNQVKSDVPKILEALKLWSVDQLKEKLVEAKVEFPAKATVEELAVLVHDNIPLGRLNLAEISVAITGNELPAGVKSTGGMKRGSQTAG